jgi:hypothetical protein
MSRLFSSSNGGQGEYPCRIGTASLALDNHHSIDSMFGPALSADKSEASLDLLVEICHDRKFGSL